MEHPSEPPDPVLRRAVLRLVLAQVGALSLWFSAAAVLPALAEAHGLPVSDLAGLSTATQIGFVVGALALAATGAADRFDPRRLFAICSGLAAIANLMLLIVPPDDGLAWVSRAFVGAMLAGVYPVGLKIAVAWSQVRRGLVTSLLVGALTLGSSSPHLVALLGGTDAQATLLVTSGLAVISAVLVLSVGLGPFHRRSPRFDPGAIPLAVRDPGIRAAYLGYLGHMWELYAFWAWVGLASAQAASASGIEDSRRFGAAVAFAAIALGAAACLPAGWIADRYGKVPVARAAMLTSCLAGLVAAATFSGSLELFVAALMLWGLSIVPDSPQFSALVADYAPPDKAGSLMTLQTALGFALTAITVQLAPGVADRAGWPTVFVVLAMGPALGLLGLGRGGRRPPHTSANIASVSA